MDHQLKSPAPRNVQSRFYGHQPAKRGVALLLVLAAVALLTIMIVSLSININSELHTSKLYANGSSVKLLSQTAVDLVMAEIYQGTSGCAPGSSTLGSTLCWASQPGMIRTYDTSGTGIPAQYYKLYSDATMTGTGVFDHTQTLVPTNWYSQQGVYVDLNQPIAVNGVNQYPIVDGDASANDLTSPSGVSSSAGVPGSALVMGPLVSTTSGSTTTVNPQVAGFWVNTTGTTTTGIPIAAPVDPSSPNQVPMPVMWLYVLRDGKIAYPDTDTGGTTVKFSGSKANGIAPSANDPIVGRIAFWTDDETNKVNINTASEGSAPGSFSDTPRVCTPFDLNLAQTPAWQNEFQRYPGHPATVSLSAVFGNLTLSGTFPENIYSPSLTTPGIAPRTIGGGSKEGTTAVTVTASGTVTSGAVQPLLGNRLYATADEILLQPILSGSTRGTNSPIDQAALKRAQFFITANSRAPDVNVFNLPRVCVWPISAKTPVASYQTPFDQLIAFCTTIGTGNIYYFQRSDWTSPNEYNLVVSPATTSRNSTLISYLKNLCSSAIPGFGTTTFASKYNAVNNNTGTELDQILMEIFDYVRATNIYDSSLSGTFQYNPSVKATGAPNFGFGEVVPSYNATNDTKGFGRYPIISKAGILFIASGTGTFTSPSAPPNPQVIGGSPGSPTYGPPIANNKVRVQAALLFHLFDPAQGYTALIPDCSIKICNSTISWNISATGTQTASNTSSSMFPGVATATGATFPTTNGASQTVAWGGNLGILPILNAYSSSLYSWVPTLLTQTAPTFPVPDFNLNGPIMFTGTVEAQVLTSSGTVVQDTIFTFPADSIAKTPGYVSPTLPWPSGAIEQMSNFSNVGANISGRMAYNTNHTGENTTHPWLASFIVSSNDILQGIQCTTGDLRLVAGHHTIPPANTYNPPLFGPNQYYGQQFAHNFVDGLGMPWYGATRGQLVSGVTSYWSSATGTVSLSGSFNVSATGGSTDALYQSQNTNVNPIETCEPEGFGYQTTVGTTGTFTAGVTAGSTASLTSPSTQPQGDFDNGTGAVRDGPYINKADEGGLSANSGYIPYFMDSGESYTAVGTTYFSPAREMPSAVMFGSLSTGVIGDKPWQTLLFHPDPTGLHAGARAPRDHLMVDLFTMPVVEPYAISEPLSTAGRINMNYLIVPFNYINRDTGIRAVLESQQMLAVPNADSGSNSSNPTTYKQLSNSPSHSPTFSTAPATLRYSINLPETLQGFAGKFNSKDIFHSASEICTLPLVPNDGAATYATCVSSTGNYWYTHQLTGDNSRERPYANIYPLLTTKSNTFTVHFRVQSLQAQGAGADPTTWQENPSSITSEYRGSQTIERYVDPSAAVPDYAGSYTTPATLMAAPPLSSFYRFRVVSTKQFSP